MAKIIRTFRLEFSEKQQWLRMDNHSHEPETNGFVTIVDYITDPEAKLFYNYIESIKDKPYTVEFLLECKNDIEEYSVDEIEAMIENNKPNQNKP